MESFLKTKSLNAIKSNSHADLIYGALATRVCLVNM